MHARGIPDDLLLALRRLQAERPGTWHEAVAEAVTAIGGTDSADLLAMAADRAASGMSQVVDEEAGDPEQALAAMEEELRSPHTAPDPSVQALFPPDLDLLANLPPPTPSRSPSPRSMDN